MTRAYTQMRGYFIVILVIAIYSRSCMFRFRYYTSIVILFSFRGLIRASTSLFHFCDRAVFLSTAFVFLCVIFLLLVSVSAR